MKMFCKYCCKYENAGSFIVSSPVFKLESIKAHNSSASHMKWALREKEESKPGSSVADETMDQLGKATFDKMCKLFRNAHDHIQTVWMCTLDDMKGLQTGNTYRNDKQCATFIHHMAHAQRNEIKEMVPEAKFVSLICDGSTDNSHTEAELAYVRYCHQGSINVHFVGVKIIAKGDAQVIEMAMSTLFTDYFAGPSWEKKIVGTDGASTMLGKNNGFVGETATTARTCSCSLLCTQK